MFPTHVIIHGVPRDLPQGILDQTSNMISTCNNMTFLFHEIFHNIALNHERATLNQLLNAAWLPQQSNRVQQRINAFLGDFTFNNSVAECLGFGGKRKRFILRNQHV